MDLESIYEIDRVAGFISARAFRRVALQFPDELLKDSTRIVASLHEKLRSFNQLHTGSNGDAKDVRLYVMADTMYGNCCVDEVGASHANADCVIHYGHTCFSPTSTLPAFLVLGKASLNVPLCAQKLCEYTIKAGKPILEKRTRSFKSLSHIRKECLDYLSFRMDFHNREIDRIAQLIGKFEGVSLPQWVIGYAGKQANTASLWLSPVTTMMNEDLGMTSGRGKYCGGVSTFKSCMLRLDSTGHNTN